jgi:hypothetical protein
MTPKRMKRKPGPPARYGYRPTLTVRLQEPLYEVIKKAAAKHGKSLSEEIEDRLEAARDIDQLRAEAEQRLAEARQMAREASTIQDAAHVAAYRAAGLLLLRDVEGNPTRVIVSVDMLKAEGDNFLRSGFIRQDTPPPASEPLRPMTGEENRLVSEEIRRLVRDATAPRKKDNDEAA